MAKILTEIDTKLGKLQVRQSAFGPDEYPGFVIQIERDGKVFDFAMCEVDQSDPDVEPVLKVHVWDTKNDDPVFDYEANAEMIDSFNKEEF